MKALYDAARDDASKQKLKVEELRGILAKSDDACLELARVRSKHAEETEAVQKQHRETLGRLRKEADEDRNRLSGMLGEVEEKLRRRDRDVADMGESIQWQQGKIKQLSNELSQARSVVDDKQLRINDLKDRVELVRADKLRAMDEAKELTGKLARLEEEMTKLELDSRDQTRALQGELSSSRSRNTELETRVGELEEQVVLLQGRVAETEGQVALLRSQVVETETRLAMLKGEQDVTCSDAYHLGVEECRNKISKEHPEWDLSFLDVEAPDASASGDEGEDEYIDVSDTDLGTTPGPSEAAAPGGHSQTVAEEAKIFEMGESSHASTSVVEGSTGADPVSDS